MTSSDNIRIVTAEKPHIQLSQMSFSSSASTLESSKIILHKDVGKFIDREQTAPTEVSYGRSVIRVRDAQALWVYVNTPRLYPDL